MLLLRNGQEVGQWLPAELEKPETYLGLTGNALRQTPSPLSSWSELIMLQILQKTNKRIARELKSSEESC